MQPMQPAGRAGGRAGVAPPRASGPAVDRAARRRARWLASRLSGKAAEQTQLLKENAQDLNQTRTALAVSEQAGRSTAEQLAAAQTGSAEAESRSSEQGEQLQSSRETSARRRPDLADASAPVRRRPTQEQAGAGECPEPRPGARRRSPPRSSAGQATSEQLVVGAEGPSRGREVDGRSPGGARQAHGHQGRTSAARSSRSPAASSSAPTRRP